MLWFCFRGRRFFVLVWRTLILALLVIALADPQFVTNQTKRESEERIFAFDVSKKYFRKICANGWRARHRARFCPMALTAH